MVRKLYKHEFAALFKWIIPVNLICLLISLISRLNAAITEETTFGIVSGIVSFAYIISLICLVVITFVIVISRFYKHLLSHEGYLTFTIPVSPVSHIVCKLICGSVAILISYFIAGLSLGVIFTSAFDGEVVGSFLDLFKELLGFDLSYVPTYRVVILVVSYCITSVISIMSGLLFAYAAMALGQRSQKNRVASAVGWYFIISIGRNIITSIYEGLMSLAGRGGEEVIEESALTVAESTMRYVDSMQVSTVMNMIDALVWGALFFWITTHMLTKKLNLE